jgi:hypothetical protein
VIYKACLGSGQYGECLVAFRGVRGIKDTAQHPGSPILAYALPQVLDQDAAPDLPLRAVQQLANSGKRVSFVGYSFGGIAAYGTALQFGNQPWLKEIILYNPTTMFWPYWWAAFSNGDNGPSLAAKTTSWLIQDDPLSEGIPGRSWVAPTVPGITHVLPACGELFDNHPFANFAA